MHMAIYRRCACLELNKLKSPLKVDERSVDILTWSLLVWYWSPVTAVSDSRDSKHQHCWCRSGKQVSASKTQLAASVTQFFCRVDEALATVWIITPVYSICRDIALQTFWSFCVFNIVSSFFLSGQVLWPETWFSPQLQHYTTSLAQPSDWCPGSAHLPYKYDKLEHLFSVCTYLKHFLHNIGLSLYSYIFVSPNILNKNILSPSILIGSSSLSHFNVIMYTSVFWFLGQIQSAYTISLTLHCSFTPAVKLSKSVMR